MTAGAGQAQGGVVVVGGGLVDVGALADQELGRAVVAGPNGLHQGGAASFGLMFEVCPPFEEEIGNISVA